jgi:cytochrome c2
VNKIGPSPAGIVGSKSGTLAGYAFSAGRKNPNKMFYRLSDPTDRQNAIAYLGTLKQ